MTETKYFWADYEPIRKVSPQMQDMLEKALERQGRMTDEERRRAILKYVEDTVNADD